MIKPLIRYAEITDAEEILKINVNSWKLTYKNIFPREFLDNICNDEEKFKEKAKKISYKIQQYNNYIVAVYNNKIVGFCNFGESKKDDYKNYGEIYALYVDNEYLNNGIGSQLFSKSVEIMKDKYIDIIVSCLKENSANKFYLKKGCKFVKEIIFVLEDKKYIENLYII